jgi:tetratricopeptide (TPR) repeat protein
VLAASLVLLSLMVGIIGTTWGMLRAIQAEADALSHAKQKDDALIDKESALRAARASEQTAKTNEAIAKKAQAEAVENLGHALAAVEQMLFRVGNNRLANVPQMETIRRELLGDALAFYEKFLDKHSTNPLIRERTAMMRIRLAGLHRMLGQHTDAEVCFRTSFAEFDELAAKSPLKPNTRAQLSNFHRGFAECLMRLGKKAEAESQLRAAVALAEGLVKEFPQDHRYLKILAIANTALVHVIDSEHPEEAEEILRRNLALDSDEFALGRTHHQLGILASRRGRHPEAEEAFRKALELQEAVVRERPTEPGMRARLAETLNSLGDSLAANGRLNEAEKVCARAAAIWDQLAADYPATHEYLQEQPNAHFRHAVVLERLNITDDAANEYRKSMEFAAKRATESPDVPKLQQLAWDRCLILGHFLVKVGSIEEAQHVFSRAEPFLEKLDADAPTRFKHWQELYRIHTSFYYPLLQKGKQEEARACCRSVVAIMDKLEKEYGAQDEYRGALAKINASGGWFLHHAEHSLEDREKLARRVQAHARAAAAQLPDDSGLRTALAHSHHQLGNVLRRTARAKDAEPELRQAASLYEKLAKESPEVAEHRSNLAHVHNGLGWGLRDKDLAAAEQEHRRALALFEGLSDELPDNPWYQTHRAMSLEIVGVLRRERGDLTDAKVLLEQAIVYAQTACDLDPKSQAFRNRLLSSRAALETTVKTQESQKQDVPK